MKYTRLSVLVAFAFAIALSGCDQLRGAVIKRGMVEAAKPDRTDWLDDGALHLILCGTGSPLPDPTRAGPCAAVIAGGRFFLIDVGPGAWENVQLWRLPRAHLSGVLLTHFHSDHIGELGEVVVQSWIGGRTTPLTVYGPVGVERVVEGFGQAYSFDTGYRIAHHGEQVLPAAGARVEPVTVRIADDAESAVVLDADGLRITAFRVDHTPVEPAYGYRFEYAGRSLFITGDTAKSAGLLAGARGVDLLLSEALAVPIISKGSEFLSEAGHNRLARLTSDILDYHISPVDAVATAKQADAGMIVFTHIVPPPPNRLAARMFLEGVDDSYEGEVLMGADGMHFRLPSDSDSVERDDLS